MDLSVAVYDMADGREAAYGEDRTYVCASVAKPAILAALLLRAQDAGRWLTAGERRLAAVMIERSDNDAATALRAAAGGVAALDSAYARLGMARTSAAPAWGLTRTTARDQLTLLKAVFRTGSVLDARSRRFVTELMERVVPGQDWGVSAAGDGWALKNGWLPRTASGLWVVHSVGRADGCLIAVLSDGHTSLDAGIVRVETAAVSAVRRMRRSV
ncbi:serine hydrolase [Streptomyces sp. NBC_00872]|uniref:serine hydrolase n=1 Tax=Streptomyces sp. NBC_00872 TaxID=2903686 RepID=UPI003862EFE6|nr:class A beta-lactamase-related serine hydrolase [Streptomyces sp. NBC_00872]